MGDEHRNGADEEPARSSSIRVPRPYTTENIVGAVERLAERLEVVVDGQLETSSLIGRAIAGIAELRGDMLEVRKAVTHRGELVSVPEIVEEVVTHKLTVRELADVKAEAAKDAASLAARKGRVWQVAFAVLGVALGLLGAWLKAKLLP